MTSTEQFISKEQLKYYVDKINVILETQGESLKIWLAEWNHLTNKNNPITKFTIVEKLTKLRIYEKIILVMENPNIKWELIFDE